MDNTTSSAFVVFVVALLGCSPAPSSANDAGPTPTSDAGPDALACAPHSGFELVTAVGAVAKDYGQESLALDADGDPMVAFVGYDASKDGDLNTSALFFSAYDRASCTWKAPVEIDTVENVSSDVTSRVVTLVRDPSDGELAIAYEINAVKPGPNGDTLMMLARSTDGGVTWTKEEVAHNDTDPGSNNVYALAVPTVAMRNGKTYYAYWREDPVTSPCGGDHSLHLVSRTGDSGVFSGGMVPCGAGDSTNGPRELSPALAIDDDGNAGLAFYTLTASDSSTSRIDYFKSGSAAPVAVFDSEGAQNDGPTLSLAFEGTKPRIAAVLQRMPSATDHDVWFSKSDDGVTWSSPVQMPQDGGNTMGGSVSIAADGKGDLSIATGWTGGTDQAGTCGGPKLSTSPDDGATWTTCGADPIPSGDTSIGYAGDFVTMLYAPDGKRVMAFGHGSDNTPAALFNGVTVWREP